MFSIGKHNISFRLTLLAAGAAVLLGILMSAGQIIVDAYNEKARSERAINQILDAVRLSASRAAYQLNAASAEEVLSGLLAYGAISQAELLDDRGRKLAQVERSATPATEWKWASRFFSDLEARTIVLQYENYPQPVGQLSIKIDPGFLSSGVVNRMKINAAAQFAQNILLATILIILFRAVLTTPLTNLINKFREVDPATKNAGLLETPAGHEHDELGILVTSINQHMMKRRETDRVLRESEERYKDLIEGTTDLVTVVDSGGKFLFVNHVAGRILGISPKDCVGLPAFDFVLPEDRDATRAAFHSWITARQNTVRFNNRQKGRDGSICFVEWNISIFYDDNGDVKTIQSIGRDITETKKSEEALRRAQKMEVLGQLTGGIAHDFNNILGVVMGNLELIREMVAGDSKILKRVDTALRGVGRGQDITKKLLGFSRQTPYGRQKVSVNRSIENMRELIAKSLTASIEIENRLADDLWQVDVDPGDLEDAILNLALNAKDAMSRGGGILIIETANRVLDEDHARPNASGQAREFVMVSVSDTGTGMSPEVREKAFEPFFSTKEEGRGTGLGLSMVYGFAQRSGGHINIDSTEDEGTTVCIYLPRAQGDITERQTTNRMQEKLAGGAETILVVDDEEALAELAVTHLERLGYKTLMATSPAQALKIIKDKQHIDLLFCDVIMPGGMDGYQLALAVHKIRPDLKILLTSGFTSEKKEYTDDEGAIVSRLSANLLNKPYRRSELAVSVRAMLDEEAWRASAPKI